MPRLSKALPKYRKHKASGQALVTLNGVNFYLGPHGTRASKIEYDRLIGEWLEGGRRLPVSKDEITIVELISRYWHHARQYYVKNGRPTDEQACIKAAVKPLRELYGRINVSDFGPLSLKAVRQRMVERGNSRKYVNKSVGRIKRMFKWGVENELVPVAGYQALMSVAGLMKGRTEAQDHEPVDPISDEIVDATLQHLRPKVADMVRLQRLTGSRPGEICIMRPEDIDRSTDVWTYRPASHKTEHRERSRVIFIGPKAQAILRPYLLRVGTGYCFRALGKPEAPLNERLYREAIYRACEKVFPPPAPLVRQKGETDKQWKLRLTPDQWKELLKWQADHRWSPNQLRHTAGTEIRSRFGLEAAQVVLGHAKADVTQVYAERDTEIGIPLTSSMMKYGRPDSVAPPSRTLAMFG